MTRHISKKARRDASLAERRGEWQQVEQQSGGGKHGTGEVERAAVRLSCIQQRTCSQTNKSVGTGEWGWRKVCPLASVATGD